MDSARHLMLCIILSILVVGFGTAGYMVIEGWNLMDALFMTAITLTTVGYSEVNTLSVPGRIFTIFLIFSSFGFFVYVAGAVVRFMLEGQIRTILGRRRLDNKINRLKNHYIVCGYGRIGRVLVKNLREGSLEIVVIEKDLEMIPQMEADGVLYICGEAADDENLIKARVDRARAMVAVLGTDADNVFLVLTARQLNKKLEIIARAGNKDADAKLRAAGANRVESPYDMGAVSMAQRIMRPTVTSFLDLAIAGDRKDIQMEEIAVGAGSGLVNVMLKDSGIRQKYDLIIIAVKKKDGSMIFNPSFEAKLKVGDTVIAVGREDNLHRLGKKLNPRTRLVRPAESEE